MHNEIIFERIPKKIYKINKKCDNSFRGTQYRGVSRNGNQYQISIAFDEQKFYLGSLQDIELAGLISDIVIIQAKGIESKLNFELKRCDLLAILFE